MTQTTGNTEPTQNSEKVNSSQEHFAFSKASIWSKLTFGWGREFIQTANQGKKFNVDEWGRIPEEMTSTQKAQFIEEQYFNSQSKNLLWILVKAFKGKSIICPSDFAV